MSQYCKAATRAVELYTNGLMKSPQDAWKQATIELFGNGTSSQKKGCPKDAFLGLCEEGFIKDIPRGNYTSSIKNKKYALNAINVLKQNPAFAAKPVDLWKKVMNGENKVHNQQMDVVTSLWEKGLII